MTNKIFKQPTTTRRAFFAGALAVAAPLNSAVAHALENLADITYKREEKAQMAGVAAPLNQLSEQDILTYIPTAWQASLMREERLSL